MVHTVSQATDTLRQVLKEAAIPGPIAEPVKLIAELDVVDAPLSALNDHDRANQLFNALYFEFGMTIYGRLVHVPIKQDDCIRWASLVRWLLNQLDTWRRADDPADRRLVAMFVVAQATDWENALWELMPPAKGTNAELIERLKKLVGSIAPSFGSRFGAQVPIWEGEAVEKFVAADHAGDWAAIAQNFHLIDHQLMPNTIVRQAVQFLARCGIGYLADGTEAIRQTVAAVLIARVVPQDKRVALGCLSNNAYMQFGCVLAVMREFRARPSLSAPGERDMTDLLLKVAADEPRWAAWMKAFNTHPQGCQTLQVPLGRALADGPDSSLAPYVNAISLYPWPANSASHGGRSSVAICLNAFRAQANLARRQELWKLAHARWRNWDFDNGHDTHLIGICWSALDYAVVGYAVECLNDGERTAAANNILADMQNSEFRWHASVSDVMTSWNRSLSRLQPFAHAQQANATQANWLTVGSYLPFDPAAQKYVARKYRFA